MTSHRPNLIDLAALAVEAGREIISVRRAGFDAETKSDGSIVTIADQRAEAIIEQGLARLAPHIPMIGEESVAAGRTPDVAEHFFCVDPLDGTRGFSEGGEEFTVNIGLIEHGEAVMGVVFVPMTGALYAGEPGRAQRAFVDLESVGTPVFESIAPTAKPADHWRLVASRSTGRNTQTLAFAAALGPHVQEDASSSLKFCRLAEGAADLYPRFGAMQEWDAAAGHAILAAVGGGVMRLDGAPLTYTGRNSTLCIPGLVAYANAESEAAARAALQAIR